MNLQLISRAIGDNEENKSIFIDFVTDRPEIEMVIAALPEPAMTEVWVSVPWAITQIPVMPERVDRKETGAKNELNDACYFFIFRSSAAITVKVWRRNAIS